MSPEEKELLNRSIALSEENNQILLSMQKSMRISRIMSYIYWLFLIGSAVGAYYLIQPYVDQLLEMYGSAKSSFGDFSGVIDSFKDIGQ